MAIWALVGRVLLSLLFIGAAANKLADYDATLVYMTQHQLPLPEVLLPLTIFIEAGLGTALLLGYRSRTAAAVLALFLLPTTLIFHSDLIVHHDHDQSLQLLKNLAILGGLLNLAAHGPGGWSIDARAPRRPRLRLRR